jgi:hypothetical protein
MVGIDKERGNVKELIFGFLVYNINFNKIYI